MINIKNNIFKFADQAHNVTIHNKGALLRAGSQHEFTCEAIGSRPAATLTWWITNQQIHPQLDNVQMVSSIVMNCGKIYLASYFWSFHFWCQFHQHFTSSFYCKKVFCGAIFYLQFGFVSFWQKNIIAKATRKTLVPDHIIPMDLKIKNFNKV